MSGVEGLACEEERGAGALLREGSHADEIRSHADAFPCRRFSVDAFSRSVASVVTNRPRIAACGVAEGRPAGAATMEACERDSGALARLGATSSDENLDGKRGHGGP